MSQYTNQAKLSYNGNVTNSNVVTDQLLEVISATKTAVMDDYVANDDITFVISIVNLGLTAMNGLTVTDYLGEYPFGEITLVTLTYVLESVHYYVNGEEVTPTPDVTPGPPLVFTGINVPAHGYVLIVYEAYLNQYAPLDVGGTIESQATVSGGGLSTPVQITETINTQSTPNLTISESICPTIVTVNDQLTYTFVIENTGNTEGDSTANIVITDTFDPILDPITVTFNEAPWTDSTNYDYNITTDVFKTNTGKVTVPAAAYTQNPFSGVWTVTPGHSTLVVTGAIMAFGGGGDGSEANPYRIRTLTELMSFRDEVNSGNTYEGKFLKLAYNIDLYTAGAWTPIGDKIENKPFKGSFDGNNKTISNMTIPSNAAVQYQALFGLISSDAVVKNLTVSGTVAASNAAGIVARMDGGTISGCVSNVDVTGSIKAGGVVCLAQNNSTIVACINNGDISCEMTANGGVAGIVGYIGNGEVNVTDCANTADISEAGSGNKAFAGGICGYVVSGNTGEMTGCVNSGDVSGGLAAGGIIGTINNGYSVTSSYNSGDITSATDSAGGIVGSCYNATIEDCVNAGTITGVFAGGVAGQTLTSSIIKNCAGGTEAITATNPGRLIGSVITGPDNYVQLYVASNGDSYTGINTVGIFAPYTGIGGVTVKAGNLVGESPAGGNVGYLVFEANTAWDDHPVGLNMYLCYPTTDSWILI